MRLLYDKILTFLYLSVISSEHTDNLVKLRPCYFAPWLSTLLDLSRVSDHAPPVRERHLDCPKRSDLPQLCTGIIHTEPLQYGY